MEIQGRGGRPTNHDDAEKEKLVNTDKSSCSKSFFAIILRCRIKFVSDIYGRRSSLAMFVS